MTMIIKEIFKNLLKNILAKKKKAVAYVQAFSASVYKHLLKLCSLGIGRGNNGETNFHIKSIKRKIFKNLLKTKWLEQM